MSATLRLVKHAHACVELQRGPDRILVDPGALGEPPALDGVSAILVTHGHYDHARTDLLTAALARGIDVLGPADLADQVELETSTPARSLTPGDRVEVAGFTVECVGGRHAAVHPEIPGPENLGYLVDRQVLVTGDQHPVLDRAVPVLVTPVDAPWLRAVDLISYVRRVRPDLVLGVHDGLLNDDGLGVADAVLASLTREGAARAVRLPVGEHLDLPPFVDQASPSVG